MRLTEFVSADPFMEGGGWRQELVAGTVRTLEPRGEAVVDRTLSLATAVASCLKRAKGKGRITMGSGLGMERPEGDEFRVADLILALPDDAGRRFHAAAVFVIVGDVDRLTDDEQGRLEVFKAGPAVREILLLAAETVACRHLRKFADGWSEQVWRAGAVPLATLSTSLFLAAVYPEHFPEESG